jgi:hypothetical protein
LPAKTLRTKAPIFVLGIVKLALPIAFDTDSKTLPSLVSTLQLVPGATVVRDTVKLFPTFTLRLSTTNFGTQILRENFFLPRDKETDLSPLVAKLRVVVEEPVES